MEKTTYAFTLEKLRYTFMVGAPVAICLLLINGKLFASYSTGFILGCMNFILLAVEINTVLGRKPSRIKLIHFIIFLLRYGIVLYVVFRGVKYKDMDLFSLFGGLLTLNFSIVIFAYLKHFAERREEQNGRG